MKKIITTFLITASLFGCASVNTNVSKTYVSDNGSKASLSIKKDSGVTIPADQEQLLEKQIREGLIQKGILAADDKSSQHSVIVNIHAFKMRNDASRLFAGALAGCDDINSTITVTDKISGKEIGNSQISINECAAWGVASQVIKKYTDGVVAYLTNK